MESNLIRYDIEQSIFFIRGQKVMLSSNLAELYNVEPRALIQAVKRNSRRFPEDFMFILSIQEVSALRSQNVILDGGRGKHSKYSPYAFTQEGIAMLSSVLKSERAIEANIAIMRTFAKLRQLMDSHKDLAEKINALEKRYDSQFKVVFNSIRELISAKPEKLHGNVEVKKQKLGFGNSEK